MLFERLQQHPLLEGFIMKISLIEFRTQSYHGVIEQEAYAALFDEQGLEVLDIEFDFPDPSITTDMLNSNTKRYDRSIIITLRKMLKGRGYFIPDDVDVSYGGNEEVAEGW